MAVPSSRRKIFLWTALSLPFLAIVLALAAGAWVRAYLHGKEFRRLLSTKVSDKIRADGEFGDLDWSGSSFYADSYRAQGWIGTNFESLEAGQVRASVDLQGLWDRKWKVDALQIERLKVIAGKGRIERHKLKIPRVEAPSQSKDGWLPNQVELGKISIAALDLDALQTDWPLTVRGVALTALPEGENWKIASTGGRLQHAGWPDISFGETRLRYVSGLLYVTSAQLNATGGGAVQMDGTVSFDASDDTRLNVALTALPAGTVLPEDWRAKLHGQIFGTATITQKAGTPISEGHLELKEGRLEAIPILDQLALFTHTQRFRQIALENVHADVRQEGKLTTVRNFNAESAGLLRLTGNFTIRDGKIDGEFLIGVAPGSLRYIPGAQEKVFTLAQNGFLWTTLKITGPAKAPHEDLSSRLVVAAGDEIIQQLQHPDKVKDTLKDAAQSLLDLLGK